MSLPSTRPLGGQALPPRGADALIATCPATSARGRPVMLSGSFRLCRAAAAVLGCAPHRALTVALVPGVHANAVRVFLPFVSLSLFDDDLLVQADDLVGFFQVDLAAYDKLDFDGGYHVCFSLGRLTSPALPLAMR